MADFNKAFQYAMSNEDDPAHPGKVTTDNNGGKARLGLNSKANPDLVKLGFYDEQQMPYRTAVTVAQERYKLTYWFGIGGDKLASNCLGAKLFDLSVNAYYIEAAKLLQRSLCALGAAITVDGHIGPLTISAANAVDVEKWKPAFLAVLKEFRSEVEKENPQEVTAEIEKDWAARDEKFPPSNL